MSAVMSQLAEAINSRDLEAFVALFADDYRSDQPAHPSRSFRGADQVRENWSSVFAGVPDITAELLSSATASDGTELGEWHWRGTHLDGSAFAMSGVIVVGVHDGQITWGRLYMEPVDDDGETINEMVRDSYRPPGQT